MQLTVATVVAEETPNLTQMMLVPPCQVEPPVQQWTICLAKRLEHERLLRTMGNSRGNYIAQIGPLDFKFGSTDRSIMDRTTEHVKDFTHFYLIFAEHCANTSMAESQFKLDPLIKKRRKNMRTERNNHTEIVTVDEDVTETTLKALYLKYIQQVDAKERFVLNAKYAATASASASTLTSSPLLLNNNLETSSVNLLHNEGSPEPKKRFNLEVLKLVQDHEFRMKKLEWEQTKWSAMHVAGLKSGDQSVVSPPLPSLSMTTTSDEQPATLATTDAQNTTVRESDEDCSDCESELSELEDTDREDDDKDEQNDVVECEELKELSPTTTRTTKRSADTSLIVSASKERCVKRKSSSSPTLSNATKTIKTRMIMNDVYIPTPRPSSSTSANVVAAKTKKSTAVKKAHAPLPPRTKTKHTLLKISTFNERPTAEFKSIREAANSCRTYEYRRLANAIKTGIPYKSYRWRLVQQPSE